jgi:hypothetical protein
VTIPIFDKKYGKLLRFSLLDSNEIRYDHLCDLYSISMNKRQLKEMKNCVEKLLSPHSDISTQSITPVKRTSRFDRVSGGRDMADVNDFELINRRHEKRKPPILILPIDASISS